MVEITTPKRYSYMNGNYCQLKCKLEIHKSYFSKGNTWFIVYEDGYKWDTNFSASGNNRFRKSNFRLIIGN